MFKDIIKHIPGFRSNTKWKMVVASMYYILCVLVAFSSGIKDALIFLLIPFVLWVVIKIVWGLICIVFNGLRDPRFKQALKEESNKQIAKRNELKAQEKELKDKHVAYCPKCLSTSLSAQKKGYGVGKAVIAGKILNSASDGIFIGGIGRNKMYVYCMNCGYKFKPHR